MLKIGDLELDSVLILAPMAGVTDSAYKQIVRECGAGLICTEMVNDRAILHGNKITSKMIEFNPKEKPVAIQLFGFDPVTMAQAAKYLDEETDYDIIDINMGCPAPKITKNDSGSKILRDPQKVFEITKAVVDVVKTKPVTVKMRLGWDENSINVIENAKLIEKAGAKAITIHGRTTKQQYTGKSNWDYIAAVKKEVNIPIIGNGDIDSPFKAKEYLEKYGVDGLMIGRAAMGAPWIFKEINHFLETGILLEKPTLEEKMDLAIRHFSKSLEIKPEKVATMEMRGHAANYIKGENNARKLKTLFQTANNKEEMMLLLKKTRDGKMKNLFLFDIDGTILPMGSSKIPESTKEAITYLINQGNEIVIATGKAYSEAKWVAKELGVENIISTNGQVLHMNGKLVYENKMDFDEINKLVKDNKKKVTFGIQSSDESYIIEGPFTKTVYDFLDSVSIKRVECFNELQKNIAINQVWIIGPYHEINIPNNYHTKKWSIDNGCDMIEKGVSKAKGLEKFIEASENSYLKIFAFGDGDNDIEMIKKADVGIAMGNSEEKVKEIADYTTSNCDEDGIYKFLTKNHIIGES